MNEQFVQNFSVVTIILILCDVFFIKTLLVYYFLCLFVSRIPKYHQILYFTIQFSRNHNNNNKPLTFKDRDAARTFENIEKYERVTERSQNAPLRIKVQKWQERREKNSIMF